MRRLKDKNIFNLWRRLVNFWTLVFVLGIIYDFLTDNLIKEGVDLIGIIYIGVLAIYVGNKEFERWHDTHKSKHPGELFVIFWTVFVFILISLDVILEKTYQVPCSVISVYVAVLTILAITSKSKKLHQEKISNE